MKNIVVKFKTGYVGMAHNLNGEIETHKFEQEELGFAVGKQTPDTGIPNVFWAMDSILKQVSEVIAKNPKERVQIAVPGTVYALASNLEMLTKIIWTHKMVYNTVTDQKSHRTILLHRKTADQYLLSEPEWIAYRSLFSHIKKLMGFVLFVDSNFINNNPETAKTPDQQAWLQVNQACNALMGMSARGAQSPYASVGNGTGSNAPAYEPSEDDECPF